MYSDAAVANFITDHFVPVRVHVREGFLPADDFLAMLKLGLGRAAFERGDFTESERRYREVVEQHPDTEAAPEAMYWEGVARYKGSDDATALTATAARFATQYQQSSWARKASVWVSP